MRNCSLRVKTYLRNNHGFHNQIQDLHHLHVELIVPDQEGDTPDNWESSRLTKPSVSVEAEAEERLLQQALWDELRRKFQIYPDAVNQLQAVILKHAFEYTNQKIADVLQAPSSGAVSTLIYRGMKKLQSNQALETLYGQWFELQMGDKSPLGSETQV